MKHHWPLAEAGLVANEIVQVLEPGCERCVIAGSIRRRKPEVGDIEILYVPWIKLVPDENDLMRNPVRTNLADKTIAFLEKSQVLERRKNAKGSEVFGEQNKLMMHAASGIPVDLFATTEECWFNALVVRTGPAELNRRIAVCAHKHGWRWNAYGQGFTALHGADCTFRVTEEEDVFRLVGLPYLPPEERK